MTDPDSPPPGESPRVPASESTDDLKKTIEIHPVWIAIGLVLMGALAGITTYDHITTKIFAVKDLIEGANTRLTTIEGTLKSVETTVLEMRSELKVNRKSLQDLAFLAKDINYSVKALTNNTRINKTAIVEQTSYSTKTREIMDREVRDQWERFLNNQKLHDKLLQEVFLRQIGDHVRMGHNQ